MGAFPFDVVEFDDLSPPDNGEVAPDFTRPLVTQDGWHDIALSDLFEDESVLLIFYPMNGSGKSHYTWKAVREREWEDAISVVGVGISQPFDMLSFVELLDLTCGIYSDPSNGVAEQYGLVHDVGGMTGIEEPVPAMFLLEAGGVISESWVAGEWPEQPPYDRIDEWIK
ncbi:MAG: redoxin domain-containing protein [Natronomonas sp.]|uniref:redoxin domain-containing protein n=1 Tax=Natronomonas sp. TaxID=2184060 RepID=UPI0028704706|nr:redoxin domain-containing protein [Natronomonas sp.]MDR9432175.1 redoxin domain-containing protein [Natronomonas sp.]